MQYTLIVRSDHLNNSTALSFARETCKQHTIGLIYFIFNGAYNANKFIEMPTDEPNISKLWQELATEHNIPLLVCPASGARRGIIESNLMPKFRFGSIGELVEACQQADKVVCL